ncbi:hypothetical protein C8Q75DRAFT_117509 [Abortiporus biennis]|nr:hypothetical protein C8Q75DRAFT_117509 [Abortiporus biennis]
MEPRRATISCNMVHMSDISIDLHKYYCQLGYGTEVAWPPPLSSKYLHLYFYALIYERRTQIDGKENHLDTRNATEGQENLTKQPSLAYSLLQGATMQSCSQDISDGELSHRIFSVFSILDDLLEDDEIGEDTWSECITKFEELRILPLLTQMLSIEIRSGRGQGHSYEFAVEMQDKFMERIAGAGPDDIQADLDTFCRIIRREYRKFLVALQRAPNPSPEKVQHWRDMAQRVGLSLDADEENSTNEVVTIKACSSKDCVCFCGKANHSLQICTGCKKVAYCNSKCQRKDWSEHKKTCKKPA